MSPTQNAAHGQNDTRFEDLLKAAKKLGGEKGEGDDSLAKLAIHVVDAAANGVIDLDKDKHGDGVDDAKHIYTTFAEGKSKKAIHEHTDLGIKANVSKLRALVKMGVMTTCDPVTVIDRAKTLHGAMAVAEPKTTKPAYASYVDVARAQQQSDSALTDDEIKGACRKKDAAEQTVEGILQRCEKALEKLITGEGGLKDQSEQVINAHGAIKERLAALMTIAEDIAMQAKVDELEGLKAILAKRAAALVPAEVVA